MRGLNEYYYTRVMTPYGQVDARELHHDDYIYEYRTGQKKRVMGVKAMQVEEMIRITYSDGRTLDVGSSEMICTSTKGRMHAFYAASNPQYWGKIDQYPLRFRTRRFRKKGNGCPSPYIAGAVLVNGDFEDDYVNLPMDRTAPNAVMEYLRDMKVNETVGDNMVYFTTEGEDPSLRIKWTELFPNGEIYKTPIKNLGMFYIPDEYMYADEHVRNMFIRGAFDGGYSPTMFSDTISIAHKSESRLKGLQLMLWSRGILSTVRYDPDLPEANGRVYRLDIVGDHANYPGMFYDVDSIIQQLNNATMKVKDPFNLKIVKMESIEPGFRYQIILDKPETIFLTNNYLPRISS